LSSRNDCRTGWAPPYSAVRGAVAQGK